MSDVVKYGTVPSLTDDLSREFHRSFVQTVKKGTHSEDYVNHAVVTHRMNKVLGVDGWSFRIVEVATFEDTNGLHVAHVLAEITVLDVVRQEIGVPSRISKYHDEIKAAVSDALKRCAMRYGVAIQLWHDVETPSEFSTGAGQQSGEKPASVRAHTADAGGPTSEGGGTRQGEMTLGEDAVAPAGALPPSDHVHKFEPSPTMKTREVCWGCGETRKKGS